MTAVVVRLPFACPKCGKQMTRESSCDEVDGRGNRIYAYLCIEHGFFRFSRGGALSRGLYRLPTRISDGADDGQVNVLRALCAASQELRAVAEGLRRELRQRLHDMKLSIRQAEETQARTAHLLSLLPRKR